MFGLNIVLCKREYEKDMCERSVRRCYSLVDNTSERWTKLKNVNKHVKQFKIIVHR